MEMQHVLGDLNRQGKLLSAPVLSHAVAVHFGDIAVGTIGCRGRRQYSVAGDMLHQALPETPIVVVAENDNPHRARHILNAGTRGFLPASLSLKVLLGALDLVLAGGVYVPSSLIDAGPARATTAQSAKRQNEPWSELTRRQRDVLALIAQGKSNKLIADALTMSESTVKAHVKQIIKRLHVANRTQAALLATGSLTPQSGPRADGEKTGAVVAK
jgi:DNA-binding NarL/FixJ family response regulator